MPPRFAYWTILAGGLPTAFRAAEREDLLPTFQRIKEKHADAELKWFARGKLWDSKEEADRQREDWKARMADRDRGGRERRPPDARGPGGPPRGRDWRPGGEHKDPRQKYKDAKKARNLDRRREKFARKQGDAPPRFQKPDEGASRPERPLPTGPKADRPRPDGPRFPKPRFDKPRFDKPRFEGKPRFDGKSRFDGKPRFEKPRSDRPRFDSKPRFDGKPRFDAKPRFEEKPQGDRRRPDGPRGDGPGGDGPSSRSERPQKKWDRPVQKAWDRPANKTWDRPGPTFSRPAGKPPGAHRPGGPKPGGPRPDGPAGWKQARDRDRDRPPRDRERKGPPRDKRRK